jgi:hypothetical protein
LYQDQDQDQEQKQEHITSINDVWNGILLNKILHSFFGVGEIAFLSVCKDWTFVLMFLMCVIPQTPNFALETSDIPRVEVGDMPPTCITMQCLDQSVKGHGISIPDHDVEMTGIGELPPAAIFLDFMYGAAAWRKWHVPNSEFDSEMEDGQEEFQVVLAQSHQGSDNDDDDNIGESEGNNGDNPDWEPGNLPTGRTHSHKDTEFSNDMLGAMDSVLNFSLLLRGTNLEAEMAAQEKQQEEAEMHAEMHESEVRQVKAKEWRMDQLALKDGSA